MTAKIGRPTKYDPGFCEFATELMRDGASIEEVAYELNIAKPTLYEWIAKYPAFSNAIKRGVDFSEGWWKKKGRTNLHSKDFSSTLWYMNMKNRFGWSDNNNHNVTVSDTTNVIREVKKKYDDNK